MPTKVFISWGGNLSKKLAGVLRNWLPAALQYVKPYFSPEDIEKGAKWNSEITEELKTSNIGIICLTRDNIEKPWILFEAGALSKSIDKTKVCTLLFNLEAAEVKGPLTSFQATKFSQEDFKRLVITINNSAGEDKLETSVLNSVFNKWWPDLEEQINIILKSHGQEAKKELRSEREILEEILDLTRMRASSGPYIKKVSNISKASIFDLLKNLELLSLRLKSDNKKESLIAFNEIAYTIKHICEEARYPELSYSVERLMLEPQHV